MSWSDEEKQRFRDIRESSSNMSRSELRDATFRAAINNDRAAAFAYAQNHDKKLKQDQDEWANRDKGGGCFVTTAVCGSFGKPDDCYELSTFRAFRDGWLVKQPDGQSLIDKYYDIAPKIVERINQLNNASAIYQSVWTEYLKPCLDFIEHGKFQDCKQLYVRMVDSLQKSFLK